MASHLSRLLFGGILSFTALPALAQAPAAEAAPSVAEEMDALSFVTGVSASVRSAPNGTADLKETLPFGAQVVITGRLAATGWVRVQTPNTPVGYMWAQTLAPMQIAPAGTAPAPATPATVPATPAPPSDDQSADDTQATATPLGRAGATPLVAEGEVSPSDQTDMYSITTEGRTALSIDLTGMAGDADIDLQDADGNSLGSSAKTGSDDEHISATVTAGTYYLAVTSYDARTPYSLSVSGTPGEAPPPDSAGSDPSSARALGDATGTRLEVEEWVGPGDDRDTYSFRVAERQTVRVSLTGMSADADLDLQDADGNELISVNTDKDPEWLVTTLDPGTYYLNINLEDEGAATRYRLAVTGAAAGAIPEDGAGNTPDRAGTIADLGPTPVIVRDWIGFLDRDDYWRFTLNARSDVNVLMTMETSDADIELLRASDQERLADSINVSIDPEELQLRLDPGTYLLRVYPSQGDTPYALEIRATPAK